MQKISNKIKKIIKQISKQKKPIEENATLTNEILDSFNMLILMRLKKIKSD